MLLGLTFFPFSGEGDRAPVCESNGFFFSGSFCWERGVQFLKPGTPENGSAPRYHRARLVCMPGCSERPLGRRDDDDDDDDDDDADDNDDGR